LTIFQIVGVCHDFPLQLLIYFLSYFITIIGSKLL
jgi:hypothetical protein